jgi:hypothetical protein
VSVTGTERKRQQSVLTVVELELLAAAIDPIRSPQ